MPNVIHTVYLLLQGFFANTLKLRNLILKAAAESPPASLIEKLKQDWDNPEYAIASIPSDMYVETTTHDTFVQQDAGDTVIGMDRWNSAVRETRRWQLQGDGNTFLLKRVTYVRCASQWNLPLTKQLQRRQRILQAHPRCVPKCQDCHGSSKVV